MAKEKAKIGSMPSKKSVAKAPKATKKAVVGKTPSVMKKGGSMSKKSC